MMPDRHSPRKMEQMQKEQPEVKLKSEMTLLNGCTVIIGCIIGSGIFVSPTGVLASTGSVNLSLVVWAGCGLFTMFGAYCYAELGCMIRKSGADYAYIHLTFGPFLAFVRLWTECMIARPCIAAIQSLTFALYVLKPFFPECDPPIEAMRLVAVCCLTALCFVNCASVRMANWVQDYCTYFKVFALVIVILSGFYQLARGHTANFTWAESETDPSVLALSCYSGLFAYFGWNFLNFIIEEMKHPVRDLPRAIAISCTACLMIYVLTIVAFHTTLTKAEVLGSEAVGVTFANRLYGRLAFVVPIFVALSTFGAVNGTLLTSSRLFYVGAREKQMPEMLTMIQTSHMTPAPSVIMITVLTLFYLMSADVIQLMNYLGFVTWLSIGVSVLCLPYLRWKRPDMNRPIKVSLFFPATFLTLAAIIVFLPVLAKPTEALMGLLMMFTSVPIYMVFIAWKSKPEWVQRHTGQVTKAVQKLMVVVAPDKEQED